MDFYNGNSFSKNILNRIIITDYCILEGIDAIKSEIYKNGPVLSVIQANKEFLTYKSGIYNIPEVKISLRNPENL